VRVIAAAAGALGFIFHLFCSVPLGFALGINPGGSLPVISEPFPINLFEHIGVSEAPPKKLVYLIDWKFYERPFYVSWNSYIQCTDRNFGIYPVGIRRQRRTSYDDAFLAMSVGSTDVSSIKYISEAVILQNIIQQHVSPLGSNHRLSLKKSGIGAGLCYGNRRLHVFRLSFVDVQHGFDGSFRSGGASLGGSDSLSGIDQGAEDARDSDHAGRELIETPFGLFLDSYSRAPLCAVLCIIASFGGLAVWLVLGPRQHSIWIGGIVYVLATVAALGVAAAYYR